MAAILSVVLIFGTITTLLVMLWIGKKVTAPAIFAMGTMAIGGGLAISNLSIASLRIAPGSLSAQMERVDRRANEVEALAKKVEGLATAVDNTKTDVTNAKQQVSDLVGEAKRTEENVKAIQGTLRQTAKSTLATNMFLVDEIFMNWGGYPAVRDDIRRDMNTMASFAYPDPQERAREMKRLESEMPGKFWTASPR